MKLKTFLMFELVKCLLWKNVLTVTLLCVCLGDPFSNRSKWNPLPSCWFLLPSKILSHLRQFLWSLFQYLCRKEHDRTEARMLRSPRSRHQSCCCSSFSSEVRAKRREECHKRFISLFWNLLTSQNRIILSFPALFLKVHCEKLCFKALNLGEWSPAHACNQEPSECLSEWFLWGLRAIFFSFSKKYTTLQSNTIPSPGKCIFRLKRKYTVWQCWDDWGKIESWFPWSIG
jgi:hypothetical protein